MALLSNVVAKGTHAARPSAGSAGVLYYETDTYGLFRDNGTTWDQIAWPSTPPAVLCYNSGNESINSGTLTALTFDSNRFDQGTGTPQHSTSSNTSRLVCQVAGVYQITGSAEFAANTTGSRALDIRLNGSTYIAAHQVPAATSGNTTQMTTSCLYQLAINDYVELMALHNVGSAINVLADANFSPELGWVRVG